MKYIKKDDGCECGAELKNINNILICPVCGKKYGKIDDSEFYVGFDGENTEYLLKD